MESLSRPFHSRKLSNATTFSPQNTHGGVFSGHRHNYTGASPIDVQDYREIFGSSPAAASSIPLLDLSTFREPSDALNLKFRSSRPDYSKIFGGFHDEDVGVCYEDSFARDKARSPSSKTSSSPDSDKLSHHSSDALKQFNMSYNKTSQKSKDGLDGSTRHRFIDETVPPLMEAKKHDSPSPSPTNVNNRKDYPKRSTTISSDSSSEGALGNFDGEIDVNSAASASAAALKKAIEKAQESIRIAKESVGRKKKGLRSFSSKNLKDGLKVEGRIKDATASEEQQKSKDVGRSRKYFMDSEKLFGVKKVIDEIHCKISESTKDCSISVESCDKRGKTFTVEVDLSSESKDEVRPSYAHELMEESNNSTVSKTVEDEMKVSEECDQNEKQENHKQEETCGYSNQESKESAQICDNNSEDSEVILEDDCEVKQEDDINVSEIGTEENDVQSVSSFTEEEEESNNIQLPQEEIPEIEITNEIQESQHDKERIDEVAGKENKERIDEVAAAREREREKDRLAVDRAIREARERARERAERAAVEKVTEEIRQRMMGEARERAERERAAVEKATEEIRQRMRADAAKAKLRAERAAVERATSEARQRALEKAMTKKPLHDSRASNESASALRSKAKLEKDNRILERAAKALAEKEKLELIAQKEQAERNRLAEKLDADIKKWSSGKEENLRALLSTLQYILGVESGWQAVTLQEIVGTGAVKKAYRKATLCVHPDKLQQRGASIQHKYICEKVFDLLKAAWNKLNSQER